MVASCAEAWIETRWTSFSPRPRWSPPARRRGSKQPVFGSFLAHISSPPARRRGAKLWRDRLRRIARLRLLRAGADRNFANAPNPGGQLIAPLRGGVVRNPTPGNLVLTTDREREGAEREVSGV